ncbi:hypothetical protein CAPTEDRAFT_219097 [Capitella teleta]|uniref:peptidyl-tRNA hydrolase n=1 Tax=Capitella teleta TaxID=283909 RepID=R7TFD5_CAPTE|nr:hypothetical protein CAPTEDRAFT_219097 [Capitella teleta]|eukprot:ELT92488.1 hypothetical protein CAPTEDRAFT_219097 [Capitella teleta]
MSASLGLVQYVVVRSDLIAKHGWNVGSLVAQACHACTAAMHRYKDSDDTISYLNDTDHMHKVILGIDGEDKIRDLASLLQSKNVDHYAWLEQPENIITAIATRPYVKEEIKKNFAGLKLLK